MQTRRDIIVGSFGLAAAAIGSPERAIAQTPPSRSPVTRVGRDAYFYEQPATALGCNQGWIVFDDYVIVIDANFASQAKAMLPHLRATTDKPIRYVINTHCHGEHTYGNEFWIDQGATPIAFVDLAAELQRLEPMQFGGTAPGRWEATESFVPELKGQRLRMPTMLVPSGAVFDDGTHRIEIIHPGWGHTRGDAVVWLPRDGVMFVGDVAANGPFNVMLDGNTAQWIAALKTLEAYNPRVVGAGHGPVGGIEILSDNRRFFESLVADVKPLLETLDVPAIADAVRPKLLADRTISRYVLRGNEPFPPYLTLPSQVGHIRNELTGRPFAIPNAGGITAFCCGSHGRPPLSRSDV